MQKFCVNQRGSLSHIKDFFKAMNFFVHVFQINGIMY